MLGIAIVVLLSGFSFAQSSRRTADIVLLHAHIYTVNVRQPWAEALAVRDGKILAGGTDHQIATYLGGEVLDPSEPPIRELRPVPQADAPEQTVAITALSESPDR